MEITIDIRVDDVILPFTVHVDAKNIDEGIEKAIEEVNKKLNLRPSLMIRKDEVQKVEVLN